MTDRKVPTPTILRDLLVQSVRQCNPIGMTLVDHFVAHPMFAIVFPLPIVLLDPPPPAHRTANECRLHADQLAQETLDIFLALQQAARSNGFSIILPTGFWDGGRWEHVAAERERNANCCLRTRKPSEKKECKEKQVLRKVAEEKCGGGRLRQEEMRERRWRR